MVISFEIDAYRKGRELLIVLRGTLVLQYCSEAKARLHGLFNAQIDQIYLYLSELTYLDSAGLGVLVGLKMTATQNRMRLVFLSPPGRVDDIFRVSKLDTIFEIRGGAEADVIYTVLCQKEYCLWQDHKDSEQTRYVTDPEVSSSGGQPTLIPARDNSRDDEQARRASQLCGDAVEYIRQGDLERAIEAYREVLELEPSNLAALNNLGIVYEKRTQWYDQAIQTWRRVLDLSAHNGDGKHSLRAQRHLDSLSKLTRAD